MSMEADLEQQAWRQKWSWTLAAMLCVLASPISLVLKTFLFMAGMEPFLLIGAAFLVVAMVGFLLGPVSVVWSAYIAVTEAVLGLSDDHKYFLCCSSKNRVETELGSFLPVLMFPAGMTSCLLLARRMFWKSLTARHMLLLVAASIVVAQGLLRYYEWQGVTVQCSAVLCNF